MLYPNKRTRNSILFNPSLIVNSLFRIREDVTLLQSVFLVKSFCLLKIQFFNKLNPICTFEWSVFYLFYTGYSLIYNPWHTLFFEALESVTLSLSFTAAVTYAAKLSTTTTDSSIQGLLGGVYYGVGEQFSFPKERNIRDFVL